MHKEINEYNETTNMPLQKLPKRRKGSFSRMIAAAVIFLLQLAFLVWGLYTLSAFALSVYIVFQIVSAFTVIRIVYNQSNPSYKIAWITMILVIPFMGIIFYAMWGRGRYPRKMRKRIPILSEMTIPLYRWNHDTEMEIAYMHPAQERITKFLSKSGFPVYRHEASEYYHLGDTFYPAMIAEIKKAKKFILLEFFIISKGKMWDELFEVLRQKAEEGVDVRLLYDDFGCMSTLPNRFWAQISETGIKAAVFNPVLPFVNNFYINYRNHQKICVVDGNVGFTGGVNIADEYINVVDAFGHWKDSGLKLTGESVWSLTVMFLQMWAYAVSGTAKRDQRRIYAGKIEDYNKFLPEAPRESGPAAAQAQGQSQQARQEQENEQAQAPDRGRQAQAQQEQERSRQEQGHRGRGFVQPFCDGPFNNPNNPAEYLYMQMINHAKDYIYITTPYLVLDNEMVTALSLAALSGVDVRIITPGIPDKKYVYLLTRSFYGTLLKAGVRIFEYTPGFIHSKNVVSDDETAVVGTVNMDFRSFYLHFENGVWLCGTDTVLDIKADFLNTLTKCQEVDYLKWKKRPWYIRTTQAILNIFAPML